MLKHTDPDFPSDVFIVLEALGAKISVLSVSTRAEVEFAPSQFLIQPMDKCIITRITFSPLGANVKFRQALSIYSTCTVHNLTCSHQPKEPFNIPQQVIQGVSETRKLSCLR